MSQTKRALPEGFSVLTGDELDGTPDTDDQDIALGWAIFDLVKAAKALNDNAYSLTVGDLQEISKATLLLQDIPSKIAKPF